MSAQQFVASIIEAGHGTLDEIVPRCEGMTRDQVMRAIDNACRNGLVRRDHWVRHNVAFYKVGHGYSVSVKEAPSLNGWRFGRVASVFDLGAAVQGAA